MNDTPLGQPDSVLPDLDAAVDQLRELDPADAAESAEEIARTLATQLDPPDDADDPVSDRSES